MLCWWHITAICSFDFFHCVMLAGISPGTRLAFFANCWSSSELVYIHIRFLDVLLFCFVYIPFFFLGSFRFSHPGMPISLLIAPIPTHSADRKALIVSWTIRQFNKANNALFPSPDSWPIRPSMALEILPHVCWTMWSSSTVHVRRHVDLAQLCNCIISTPNGRPSKWIPTRKM